MEHRKVLEEVARRKQFDDWRRSPLLWVKERLGENPNNFNWSDIDPKYDNHKWDGTKNPLAAAWQHLGDIYSQVQEGKLITQNNIAVESGTGTGKTYWLARVCFWFLDCFTNSLVVTSAPSEAQLKIGLWAELSMLYPKIKKLRPKAQKWKTRLAMEGTNNSVVGVSQQELDDTQIDSWQAVAFTTGVNADEVSANKARGFHRKAMLIILEECTGVPYPILTAFQNTTTGDLNFILAVGNPDNEFDTLHRFSTQKDCKAFRISALDHPNIVLQKEHFGGSVTQSKINSRTDNYGENSSLWQAMVRGISPVNSADSLIRREWVDACINSDNPMVGASYNSVGVDVANSSKGDKAATAWGAENNLLRVDEFQCNNATHLAYNLVMDSHNLASRGYTDYNIPSIQDYNIDTVNIGIDAVGIGIATVNALIDLGINDACALSGGSWRDAIPMEIKFRAQKQVEVPLYGFLNLRSQMYWQLREDIRLKRINIKVTDKDTLFQLTKELCIPKVIANTRKITVEGKEEIKKRLGGKSPNLADSVVYWNWMRLGHRIRAKEFVPLFGGY